MHAFTNITAHYSVLSAMLTQLHAKQNINLGPFEEEFWKVRYASGSKNTEQFLPAAAWHPIPKVAKKRVMAHKHRVHSTDYRLALICFRSVQEHRFYY
jgi:hypothetical protein